MSSPGLTRHVLMFLFGGGVTNYDWPRWLGAISGLKHMSALSHGHTKSPMSISPNIQHFCQRIRSDYEYLIFRQLPQAPIIPNNAFVVVNAPCTSNRLNARFDQVFALTHTATLLFLQTRICLDYSIYNGSNQSLWLYLITYDPNLGLTIAIVDWEQQGCFGGCTERAGMLTKGAKATQGA